MEFPAKRALVERLDILQDVLEAVSEQVDLALRHGIEHEGVVGIRGMAEQKRGGGRVGLGHGKRLEMNVQKLEANLLSRAGPW